MRQTVRHQLSIAALGAIVLFANLGSTRLWDQDEAYFARTAVEMHQRHEWVVPYFNDQVFAHKPPLMYWMMRVGFLLFGVNEFAARFWSAALGVASALLVYRMGRRMFHAQVGLWAGLAMCTAVMFDVVARAATPDSFLVFFSTLALYLFVRKEEWGMASADLRIGNLKNANRGLPLHGTALSADGGRAIQPFTWQTWVGIYAAMGIAVLVKGPIGVLLPGATLGLYLLVRDPVGSASSANRTTGNVWEERLMSFARRFNPARIFGTMWSMRPGLAIIVVLAVAGPWFALVGVRTGGSFLTSFFGVQNYGRFVNSMDGHSGAIWYYIPWMIVGFFPWSIFTIFTALDLVGRCRGKLPWQQGARFLACWLIVYVGFFSIAGTKLPSYLLPAYPALALATACVIQRCLIRSETARPTWMLISFGSLILVGLVTAIGTRVVVHEAVLRPALLEKWGVTAEMVGEMPIIGALGLVLLAGGAIGMVLVGARRGIATIGSLVTTSAVFSLLVFGVIAVRLDHNQPSPALATAIRQHTSGTPQVAQFGYFRPSLVYYIDGPVQACKSPQSVTDFFGQSADSFLITTAEQYARLSPQLPADVEVLSRQSDFPRRGTVVLLGRKTDVAQRESGDVR